MKAIIPILFLLITRSTYAQVDTIRWTQLSPLPDNIQRSLSAYFLIDSNFYVAGGQIAFTGSYINNMWRYHIPTDHWYQMGNIPFGQADAGASFVLNGKGYFLTARDSIQNGNCDRMLWQYNPLTDTWLQKANFPDSPRQQASYFTNAGYGYVGQTGGCVKDDNHFWKYDPILDSWSPIATLPASIPISGSYAVSTLGNYGYVIGGSDQNFTVYGNLYRYNVTNNIWDTLSIIPGSGRDFPIMWGFDSILIAGGGVSASGFYSDFYKYSIEQNNWTSVVFENSFDSAALGATFIYKKQGYYFGGFSSYFQNTFSNKLWSFDASKFFPPDTPNGLTNIKPDILFSVFPNPISGGQEFSISTSEGGSIIFYDALGGVLDERKLVRGVNSINLTTENEVVFYKATLQGGTLKNGKLVLLR